MTDKVEDLLRHLKEGKDFTKEQLQEAITYHHSFVTEIESLRNACSFQEKETSNVTDQLRKELAQLKADAKDEKAKSCEGYEKSETEYKTENVALKTELRQKKNDLFKTNKELEDSKNVIENCKYQYEKQSTELITVKKQLQQFKIENEGLKSQLEKQTSAHIEAMKNLDHSKIISSELSQGLEKLKLDDKCEKECYTRKEKIEMQSPDENQHISREKFESKVQGQPKALEKLRQENAQLKAEKLKLMEQIDELRNRLSVIAGHKLTNQNPEIADLSDAFRPTKIAEQFRELYDNEWTCAFEEIAIKFEHEEEIIDFLASVIKDTDHFCIRAGLQQLEHLKFFTKSVLKDPEYQPEGKKESEIKPLKCGYPARMSKSQEELADKLLKDFRKSLGIISNTPLMMIYRQVSSLIKDKIESIESSPLKELDKFLTKAFQLIWVMKTQDPVMEFVWCKPGNKFDKNMYTHYTKRGSTVTQCIWPAVVLHKDGPLMSKGVVQGN